MIRTAQRVLAVIGATVFAVTAYVYVTLPDVRALARTNPTTTAFMQLREDEAARAGRALRHEHRWIPYARISQNLKRAVLVAEDDAFWDHEGVDVEQLRKTIEIDWRRGRAMRGASTITQQLAKNLYLSPSRDPLRKIRELIIARRLEAELPKARIFEIYLNVIEWGDGIWGADAAARTYFGTSASRLSREQAALLAGAIINPRVYSPAHPPARLLRRQQIILGRMGGVEPPPPSPMPIPAAPPESQPVDSFAPTEVAPAENEDLVEPPPPDELPPPEPQPDETPPASPAEPPG
jgi:monofunctional glycosyltransferase